MFHKGTGYTLFWPLFFFPETWTGIRPWTRENYALAADKHSLRNTGEVRIRPWANSPSTTWSEYSSMDEYPSRSMGQVPVALDEYSLQTAELPAGQ